MALPITPASFRAAFPAFADTTKYPDAEVNFYIGLAVIMCGNVYRWGDALEYGMSLFIAHNLALDGTALSAAGGGVPGAIVGPMTGGHVDKVGYTRNPGVAMDPKNGHWNLTTWGLRYIRLVNMIGAGPVQVDVPAGNSNYGYGGAWQGVVYPPANQ